MLYKNGLSTDGGARAGRVHTGIAVPEWTGEAGRRVRQGGCLALRAADGHGVCARRRFMIYDARFAIYDPWLGSGGQIIDHKS